MAKKKTAGKDRLKDPKHELFAHLYAGSHNRDLFGNGTRCYMLAYGFDAETEKLKQEIQKLQEDHEGGYTRLVDIRERRIKSLYDSARNRASELIAKRYIRDRVNFLMDQLLENSFMDRELAFVAGQRYDLNAKIAAIREWNRMNDRTKDHVEADITYRWAD